MPLINTSAIPVSPSPRLQVALGWVDAMSNGDFDRLRDHIIISNKAAYSHSILPKSLGRPTVRGWDNVAKVFGNNITEFKEHNVTVHEIIDTPQKVVLYASSEGSLKSGYRVQTEYILILDIVDDLTGSGPYKVSRDLQFTDSTATLEFIEELSKAKEVSVA